MVAIRMLAASQFGQVIKINHPTVIDLDPPNIIKRNWTK